MYKCRAQSITPDNPRLSKPLSRLSSSPKLEAKPGGPKCSLILCVLGSTHTHAATYTHTHPCNHLHAALLLPSTSALQESLWLFHTIILTRATPLVRIPTLMQLLSVRKHPITHTRTHSFFSSSLHVAPQSRHIRALMLHPWSCLQAACIGSAHWNARISC